MPVVLAGRLLVAGAATAAPDEPAQRRPVAAHAAHPGRGGAAAGQPLAGAGRGRGGGRAGRRGQAAAGRHGPAAARGAGRARGDAAVRDRLVRCRRTGHGAVHRRLRYERGPGGHRAQRRAAGVGGDQPGGAAEGTAGGRARPGRGRGRGGGDVLLVRARAGRVDPGRRRDRAGVPGPLPALHPGRWPGHPAGHGARDRGDHGRGVRRAARLGRRRRCSPPPPASSPRTPPSPRSWSWPRSRPPGRSGPGRLVPA